MTKTGWTRVIRALLVLGAGLMLGVIAVVLSWSAGPGRVTSASALSTCSIDTTTPTQADIVLAKPTGGSTTTTVTVAILQASGGTNPQQLFVGVDGAAPTACATIGTASGDIKTVSFSVSSATGTTPASDTITFDQSGTYTGFTNQPFPCSGLSLSGAVGGSSTTSTVQINGAPGAGITVGATTLNPSGCTTNVGSLTGITNYVLNGNGAATLDATGDDTVSPTPSDPATQPVYFQAGTGNETIKPAATSATLDFSKVACTSNPCSLTVNDSGSALTSPSLPDGHAQVVEGATTYTYDFSSAETEVTTWLGLPSASTTFYGQAGNYTLSSMQNGSEVVAGAGTEGYTVSATHSLFQSGSGSDTFNVTGSSNSFAASVNGPDTFYDSGPGNTLDFSAVGTSAGANLAVNAAGAPEPAAGGTLSNGHAAVGTATPAFVFLNGPSSTSASDFTTIVGSTDGNTTFLAGGTGGPTLIGRGTAPTPGNSVQFLGGNAVAANLSGSQQVLGPNSVAPGFQLGSGQVLVSSPGAATSCNTAICDTLESELGAASAPSVTPPAITSVTGPTTGSSTFYAGPGPEIYSFSDSGGSNTFVGGSGQDSFSSAGNQNDFVAGTGPATFSETAPTQGASNTIDLSSVPVGSQTGCTSAPCSLVVNVSGSSVGNYQATQLNSAQQTVTSYGWSTGGADFTNIIGASGGRTSFDGGVGNFIYTGQGTGNTLDFSQVPNGAASSLTFDVTQEPKPVATLNGQTKEPFSGITNLVGLAAGNGTSTFVGGATGGYSFKGNGNSSTNEADFSAQGPSTTLTVNVNLSGTADPTITPLSGGTVTFSLAGGTTLCQAVPVVASSNSSGTASCTASSLPAGSDQVLAVYTPASGSGLSGSEVILTPTSTSGNPASPATSVAITAPTSGSTLNDQTSTSLSATVYDCGSAPCTGGTTTIAGGTVTFSQAGGATLCQATVNGGSTSAEQATCSATLPAGNSTASPAYSYAIVAVYQPSNPTVSGSATAQQVTVDPAELASSLSNVTYAANIFTNLSCGSFGFSIDCAQATLNNVPTGYGGTVTFSVPGVPGTVCSDSVSTASASPQTFYCVPGNTGNPYLSDNQQLVVQYTPPPNPPSGHPPIDGSGGVTLPIGNSIPQQCQSDFLFSCGTVSDTPSSTSVSVTIGTSAPLSYVIAGLPATLTANINSTSNSIPSGQVVFSSAGGGTLCTALVPGGATTTTNPQTVECSASLSGVGYDEILATYTPSNSSYAGSAADLPIQVVAPVQTAGSGSYVQNSASGVVANLSSISTTVSNSVSECSPASPTALVQCTSTTPETVDVTVGGSQVLVGAAPPSGPVDLAGNPTAACSASASFCDSVTGATVVNGSTGGHNSFLTGNAATVFGDTGTVGHDSIDFSNVPTSSTAPLVVNVTGAPVTPAGGSQVQNDTATNGTITDYFTNNGANFTSFTGSNSAGGNTNFFAGGSGGYNFSASGASNSIDFSTAPAISLTYSSAVDGTVQGLSGASTSDTVNDLTDVTGSKLGGNHFTAPTGITGPPTSASTTYTFVANDDVNHLNVANFFNGGDGTDQFTSNGNDNTFTPGTGSATITDAGTGSTVDFSNVAAPVTVNVSGGAVSPTPFSDSATTATATYDFRTFGTTPATFKGPSQGAVFYAGAVGDTFDGGATAGNHDELSFAHAGFSPLTICLVTSAGCTADTASVGSGTTTETFNSNISVFDGLSAGATTFVASNPGGDTFNATGSGNSIDYSAATQGLTVDLTAGTTGTVQGTTAHDTLSGLTTVIGSATAANTFDSGSGSYNFTGNSSGNTVNAGSGPTLFSSTGSGNILHAGGGTDTFTAIGAGGSNVFTAGSGTDTFSAAGNGNQFTGGSGSDSFTSPGNNNTFFAGTGPDTISDTGTGNTIDFGAVRTSAGTPLVVNLTDTQVSNGYPAVGSDTAQAGSVVYDFTSGGPGFTTILGSSSGNTYFAANGSAGTYVLTGRGPTNTADFSANLCGITAAMVAGTISLPSGGSCATTTQDTITGITQLIGAPQGQNTFNAALLGDSFSAASTTNTISYAGLTTLAGVTGVTANLVTDTVSRVGYASDKFSFSPGALTLEGSPGNDTFDIGGPSALALAGGGGSDTLDLSLVTAPTGTTTGATVDLDAGSITSPTIGGVSFTPGCSAVGDLCVTSVIGSPYDDSFVVNHAALTSATPLIVNGNGGNDTLDLQHVAGPATIDMPISGTANADSAACSPLNVSVVNPIGAVCSGATQSPAIQFQKIQNVDGTAAGGDYFVAGSGTESYSEQGSLATLDYGAIPTPTNLTQTTTGITVNATDTGGNFGGTVTSPNTIGVTDTFTNIGTFIGTQDNDTFMQSGPSPSPQYVFEGRGGANTLDLSAAPTGTTVQLTGTSPGDGCTSGIQNNDGTASGSQVNDTFSCIGTVISSTAEYRVAPGQNATINGGGSGTLRLVSTLTDPQQANCGVTITMPVGTADGSVQSIGCSDYNFKFTGMTTVYGTAYNDQFVPGSTNATFIGNGGTDGINYSGAPAAAVVNLSGAPYTIPAGYPNAGTQVPRGTAIGAYGGVISLQGVANATGSSSFNDILVGGILPGSLVGGGGNERLVPTGGTYTINGGTGGNNTIDLSLLAGYTSLDLGSTAQQNLGPADGSVTLTPHTVETAIASPGGSALDAGNGDGITLQGSGNDRLSAGIGNQTLIGNGAGDTLVGGIGNDTMTGGTSPVTFEPGQGNDTLTSSTTGNTLSYAGVPYPVQVNLSGQLYSVPPGEPGAGTVLTQETATGGYGATVSLATAGITNVVGSAANDILVTGSTGVTGESIDGGGGADLFVVTSGNNTLTAANGSASRFLIDGGGSNVINGGGNSWIDYSQALSGASVNLQTGTATGGFPGAVETLRGVLNVEGSNFNDVIVLGEPYATAIGLNGNDILQVSPYGRDLLQSDGSGIDTFCDQQGCNGMTSNPVAGSTLQGGSYINYFYAHNGVQDTIQGDGDGTAEVDSIDITSNAGTLLP